MDRDRAHAGAVSERLAMYDAMQRAIPGLDAMYRMVRALVEHGAGQENHRVLIVGAGGGREIAALAGCPPGIRITALDPSEANLDTARLVAERTGAMERVRFVAGTTDTLEPGERFDMVTSLMVMHHFPDDGTRRSYLSGLRDRLAPGGRLIHADACRCNGAALPMLEQAFHAHAGLQSVPRQARELELEAIAGLPLVTPTRMRELFAGAGLVEPVEIMRLLWYRCWISRREG